MWIVLVAALAQQQQIPLEWTCGPFSYDVNDGCDCGCGAPDPDCGPVPFDVATCAAHGCAEGRVPNGGDPTRCIDNVCGDSYRGGSELCDDGAGAGCSADCSIIEPGFRCSQQGAGCQTPGCGDRFVDAFRGESCDDGNDEAGDGCDACVFEEGFICFIAQPCERTTCGDGFVEVDFETRSGEGCDDGNADASDGCDQCVTQPGFLCDPFLEGSPCFPIECGNGFVERDNIGRGESCDDGGRTPGDGCDADCQAEDGFSCDRGPCVRVECGDGLISFPQEQCDDGDDEAGDGCNADCSSFEPGFSCPVEGVACHPIVCGDGVQEGDAFGLFEECDDGNDDDDDGCSSRCRREAGFICLPDGTCRRPVCGDSLIDPPEVGGNEQCDDGDDDDGDGCSSSCFVEDGFFCPGPGQPCQQPVCGDGRVEGSEQCDDGGVEDGDGCSSRCSREDDFVCREPGEPCEPLPNAWTCSRFHFASDDGCDCGCGVQDPDCEDSALATCEFNQCLEAAPFLDGDDPTQCSTTPPTEATEGEAEEDVTLSGGGCSGCSSGGAGGLLLLLGLLRRRSRQRAT